MNSFLSTDFNPFGEAARGRYDDFFYPFFSSEGKTLRTDVKEYGDHYLLEVEAPGLAKNNLDVSADNGYIVVTSTKTDKNDRTAGEWKYIRRERPVSASRSFYVGEVCEGEIKAAYHDGVLYIDVPKPGGCGNGETVKKIEIK